MNVPWPLIGRAEETRLVEAAVLSARNPPGVVLAGFAGVGKTRLAEEALAKARLLGLATRWITATNSARSVPLGAFAGVLRSDVGKDPLGIVRALMDGLVENAADSRLVLVVDDCHLLDEQSAVVVHHLVAQDRATVVLTLRTGEPVPDAITSLWKEGRLKRVEIQPLSATEFGELFTAIFDEPVQDVSSQQVWSLTGGNVLYLRHVLDEEIRGGRWRMTAGMWQWAGPAEVSPALAELINAQMGQMPASVNDVVELLAVAEPLDVSLLARLVVTESVEQAERAGLISVESAHSALVARLAHPMYGEVRRAAMGRVRARRLRGILARALTVDQSQSVWAEAAVRKTMLWMESDLEPDLELLVLGARASLELLDMKLAELMLSAACSAGGGFDAHMSRGFTLIALGRGQEAEQLLQQITSEATDDVKIARLAALRAATLFWDLGDSDAALMVLDTAERKVFESGPRVALVAMRALFDASMGETERAVEAATAVLESPVNVDQVTLVATWAVVIGAGGMGRTKFADAVAESGYRVAERSLEAAFLRFSLCDFHVLALGAGGYPDRAQRAAARMRRTTAQVPGQTQFFTASLMGHAALGLGHYPEAVRWLRQALAGLVALNEHGGWRFHATLSLAQSLAMCGDTAAAADAVRELDDMHSPIVQFLQPQVLIAKAWLAGMTGVVSEAISLAIAAADVAVAQRQPAFEVLARQAATRLGDRSQAARLLFLAGQVEGPRAALVAAHAAALAAADGAALDAVSTQLEDVGDRPAAADAAAHASVAHGQAGRRSSQIAAATRAAELLQECGGADTPALRLAVQPTPLTAREREVVTLAAQGLSNRAIAQRLFVSVRTVEGHLYRAAAKLGTATRHELAARVQRH